jgi:hypothetical protein
MCGQAGLDLPPLGEAARDGINGPLKGFGWAANPADVTGFTNSESFPQIMEHMINDLRMGTLVVASPGRTPKLQGCGPATLPHHALGSTGDDRRGQRSPVASGLSRTTSGGPEALADTLVRVSYLAMHLEGHLAELDINPLMVLPSGQGVKAVDALVVLRGT